MAKLVSMELDDEQKLDAIQPIAMSSKPDFPYGLRICLTHVEIEKLGLDPSECERGDVLDLCVRARVTSKSQTDDEHQGHMCRVELQIESLCCDDHDDKE